MNPSNKMFWAASNVVPWIKAQVVNCFPLKGSGMENLEISGSGTTNASMLVTGKSI
jgi:hypothetical protein